MYSIVLGLITRLEALYGLALGSNRGGIGVNRGLTGVNQWCYQIRNRGRIGERSLKIQGNTSLISLLLPCSDFVFGDFKIIMVK